VRGRCARVRGAMRAGARAMRAGARRDARGCEVDARGCEGRCALVRGWMLEGARLDHCWCEARRVLVLGAMLAGAGWMVRARVDAPGPGSMLFISVDGNRIASAGFRIAVLVGAQTCAIAGLPGSSPHDPTGDVSHGELPQLGRHLVGRDIFAVLMIFRSCACTLERAGRVDPRQTSGGKAKNGMTCVQAPPPGHHRQESPSHPRKSPRTSGNPARTNGTHPRTSENPPRTLGEPSSHQRDPPRTLGNRPRTPGRVLALSASANRAVR